MRDGEGILPGRRRSPRRRGRDRGRAGPGRPLERRRRVAGRRRSGRLARATSASTPTSRGGARARRCRPGRSRSAATSSSAPGEYRPAHADGRELLTHELVHVVQQRGAPRSGPLTSRSRATRSSARPRTPRSAEHRERDAPLRCSRSSTRACVAAVARGRVPGADPHDALRGLYISDDQALALAADRGAPTPAAPRR